jgi:co-chaperonin GroES (HSP10)
MIKTLKNNILFRFEDDINNRGEFEQQPNDAGIVIKASFDDSAKMPRWAIAEAVGPDVKHIIVGDRFLIPALRWTSGVKLSSTKKIWKTDESQVAAMECEGHIFALNKFFLVTCQSQQPAKTTSGLWIITNIHDEVAQGTVIKIGESSQYASADDTSMKIAFDDKYTEQFSYDGIDMKLIDEQHVFGFME